MNKIFASASFRRDASSRFHPDHRWGNFWSLGGGWLINQESWFSLRWVDMLKLKASIGSQGNDNIADYLYTDMYSITNSDGEIGVKRGSIGNKDITWETTYMADLGIDVTLWEKFTVTADYYYKKTDGILMQLDIPSTIGLNAPYQNAGVVVYLWSQIELLAARQGDGDDHR